MTGRMYFEGMYLGNEEPLSVHPQLLRQVRGHNSPSDSKFSGPVVGSYGYGYSLVVKGQHAVSDGDFVTWTTEAQQIESYCSTVTREVENRAAAEHAVLSRRLGRVGWVRDVSVYAEVSTVTDGTGDGAGFGSTRFTFSGTNTLSQGEVDVGDFVVITEGGSAVPTVGEVAEITAISSADPPTYIEFTARKPKEFGGTNYASYAVWVHPVEMSFSGYVFRNAIWTAPKTLAEGADAPTGIAYLFEGTGQARRRGQTITIEASYGVGGDYEPGSSIVEKILVAGDELPQEAERVPYTP